jgi:hypothetical protein
LKCERGTVLSGRLGTVVDGKEMVFEAGEEFAFPAGPMHTWWNAGDELLEVDGIAYPAVDLDRNLQAMFAVLNAGKPEGHRPFMRPTLRTVTVRPSTQR